MQSILAYSFFLSCVRLAPCSMKSWYMVWYAGSVSRILHSPFISISTTPYTIQHRSDQAVITNQFYFESHHFTLATCNITYFIFLTLMIIFCYYFLLVFPLLMPPALVRCSFARVLFLSSSRVSGLVSSSSSLLER